MDGTLMRKAMQAEPENYVGQMAAGQYWTWGTRSKGTAIPYTSHYLVIYAFSSQYETVSESKPQDVIHESDSSSKSVLFLYIIEEYITRGLFDLCVSSVVNFTLKHLHVLFFF